ncbi:leucine-rich repeat domain-containing protein, partial [Floccifex sp.]|uniref:leucine-rich repeat domain-containing protein n=1 Tax=Floccifex sp. TaxID=2815810 RepID=UPI003F126D68
MKKKLLSILCAICTICMLVPMTISAETSGTTTNGLKYTISDAGEVTITGYIGTDTVVNIPDTIDVKPVTAIGNYAFSHCEITSITIPNNVTSIGMNAFIECQNLTNITIPNNVTSIGMNAFYHCHKLESIFLRDGLDVNEAKILYTTKQIRYSLDNDKVTITSISGESKIELPETICGYPVVAVNSDYQRLVGEHTHYYTWTVQDGMYSGQC